MPGKRLALIVATDEYEDSELHKLRAPAKDAESLSAVLGDPELGDFEVSTLRNETHWTIGQRVEELLGEASLDDFIVLHFSCHGIKDATGELYLAAKNTRPNLLASTAVEAALVNRLVRRSRSQRIVLFLDCCFGGAFERGMSARATGAVDVADQFQQRDQDLGGGRGRVVITASSAMEFAFEGADLADSRTRSPSIFTGSLVEGLVSGAADRDKDGKFSLGEVYDYVFDRVREVSPNQTPNKFEYGVQGDFVLANNPKWVVVPGPLPSKVMKLANDPYAPTRLGSVDDLRRLAEGEDLALAAGARQQLDKMVEDDSRQVAAAASRAVEAVALRVPVQSVDLGEVEAGGRALADVTIEGPPLAAASRVSTSGPNIRVRRLDRTIRIEADTSLAGRIEGFLKVDGPAGTVEIPVTATVKEYVDTSPPAAALGSTAAASAEHMSDTAAPPAASSSGEPLKPAPSLLAAEAPQSSAAKIAHRELPSERAESKGANRSVRGGLSRTVVVGLVALLLLSLGGFLAFRGAGGPSVSGSPIPSVAAVVETDTSGNVVAVVGGNPPFGTHLQSGKDTVITFLLHYRLVSQESAELAVSIGQTGLPAVGCEEIKELVDSNEVSITKGEGFKYVSVTWHGGDSKGIKTTEGFIGPAPSLWIVGGDMISAFRASPDDCYPFGI